MMKKVILIIIIILIAGLVIWKVQEWKVAVVDTAGWKTYRNDVIGYELKHPPEFEVIGDGLSINLPNVKGNDGTKFITIANSANPDLGYRSNAAGLEDYNDNYNTDVLNDGEMMVIIHKSKKMVINGFSALKQVYSLGYWGVNIDGEKFFDTSGETTENQFFRYVLFDGKSNFVILKILNPGINLSPSGGYDKAIASEFESFLDGVASTFLFTK